MSNNLQNQNITNILKVTYQMTPEVRFSAIEKNPQTDATPFTEKYPPLLRAVVGSSPQTFVIFAQLFESAERFMLWWEQMSIRRLEERSC